MLPLSVQLPPVLRASIPNAVMPPTQPPLSGLQVPAAEQLLLTHSRRGRVPAQSLVLFNSTPSGLEGLPVGKESLGMPLTLDGYILSAKTLKQAQEIIVKRQKSWGAEDYAILNTPQGDYAIYELKISTRLIRDLNDLNLYSSLRQAQIQTQFPGGYHLAALVTDRGQMRFYQGQISPFNFPIISNPRASDSLTELDRKAKQVLDRLKMMEEILGQERDHRGIFAAMYRVITQRAYSEFQQFLAEGDYKAAVFEGQLLVNFANKYFDAYDAYAQNRMHEVPEVWRSAFDLGVQSQLQAYPRLSVTEIVGLSMVAHIIHDLPFSLKEIGFNGRDSHLVAVYSKFNQILMQEKDRIIQAIATSYGETDLEKFESYFIKTAQKFLRDTGKSKAEALELGMFSAMRYIAKRQAQAASPAQIRQLSEGLSDVLRLGIPGA